MTKHTPGPWKIDTHHGMQIGPCRIRMPDDRTAARTARLWADARLIAAAPDLLAALQRAEYWLDCPNSEHIGITYRDDRLAIRAALAKATGGMP